MSSDVIWSAYWGVPVVWQAWKRLEALLRKNPTGDLLMRLVRPTVIPLIALHTMLFAAAAAYGFAGGGFHQYRIHRRLVRGGGRI